MDGVSVAIILVIAAVTLCVLVVGLVGVILGANADHLERASRQDDDNWRY